MPLVISSWTETSNTRLSYPNTLHPSLSEAFSASLESGPYREEKAGKWRGQAEERTFSSYTADLRDRRELDPVGGHLQVPSLPLEPCFLKGECLTRHEKRRKDSSRENI